jgi:hypothetical protein
MQFGDSTLLLQYTASALYGLGISNGLFMIHDILTNNGEKLFYKRSIKSGTQQ